MKKKLILVFICLIVIILVAFALSKNRKPSAELFQAPGRNYTSSKKVEDYFIEKLRMSPEEAKSIRIQGQGNDGKISLRLSDKTTLEALISNLHYYGFIRDEKTFIYTLENTKDTTVGKANALKVGKTGTIDVGAYYKITEDMDAWQLADELLNKPTYFAYDEYGYMFMP
jgi:hypothetical protein